MPPIIAPTVFDPYTYLKDSKIFKPEVFFEGVLGTKYEDGGATLTYGGYNGYAIYLTAAAINSCVTTRMDQETFKGPVSTWDKARKLFAELNIIETSNQIIWLVTGTLNDPLLTTFPNRHFGFVMYDVGGVTHVFATCADGIANSQLDLGSLTGADDVIYEAKLDPGVEVAFYINGVLKGRLTTNLPSGETGAQELFALSLDATNAAVKRLSLSKALVVQET